MENTELREKPGFWRFVVSALLYLVFVAIILASSALIGLEIDGEILLFMALALWVDSFSDYIAGIRREYYVVGKTR